MYLYILHVSDKNSPRLGGFMYISYIHFQRICVTGTSTNVGQYKPKTYKLRTVQMLDQYKRRTVQTSDQYKRQTSTNVGKYKRQTSTKVGLR